MYGCQIFGTLQLAGGMPQECGTGILGKHTTAVICDPKKGHAAVPYFHGDLGRPGINRVFQQLLDNACRTFNHFTGSN